MEWLQAIEASDTSGRPLRVRPTWSWNGSGAADCRLWIDHTGSLILTPARIPGFLEVRPVEVSVSRGASAEAVFTASASMQK